MELGDFEQANEFEFDLSDVDVAAFESVATEDTSANAAANQQSASQEPQSLTDAQQQQLQSPPKQLQQLQSSSIHQSPKPPPTPQAQHHLTQLSTTAASQPGKILLVPISSRPGNPSFKHFLQLPAGTSSLTLGALTASGNKKQVIQLTPIAASALNVGKNNTTASTTNNSPLKNHQHQHFHHHTSNLNNVLNKSLNSFHNNVTQHISNANLLTSAAKNASAFNDSGRASSPNSTIANEVPKRKPCNCTKSQCLKLYCDCFANGEFCSGCNCTNCFNSLDHEKERQKAISQCLERNPEAFRPKIGKAVKASILGGEQAQESIERRHTKGCNCKRSGCLKNYCECYEAKILCSNLCKCCRCKNYEENFERRSLMQLSNQATENARGILKNLLPTNNNPTTGNEFTKCFITDKVIRASLTCLLQSAQQAEKEGVQESDIPDLIQNEMGKCLKMIVDSAIETTTNLKKR